MHVVHVDLSIFLEISWRKDFLLNIIYFYFDYRMGSALLSRFDLVFILLDKPDEEMDSLLSEHVMALHAGKKV